MDNKILKILDAGENISESNVKWIKEEIYKRGILQQIANLMEDLVAGLFDKISGIKMGKAPKEYLHDLVKSRILTNANKFIEVTKNA